MGVDEEIYVGSFLDEKPDCDLQNRQQTIFYHYSAPWIGISISFEIFDILTDGEDSEVLQARRSRDSCRVIPR